MTYEDFLLRRKKAVVTSGFTYPEEKINPILFDFQKYAVKKALLHGKYALFEECGLGKTFQQLEWGRIVVENTNAPAFGKGSSRTIHKSILIYG